MPHRTVEKLPRRFESRRSSEEYDPIVSPPSRTHIRSRRGVLPHPFARFAARRGWPRSCGGGSGAWRGRRPMRESVFPEGSEPTRTMASYRSVAAGPCTGQLTDQYVSGGTGPYRLKIVELKLRCQGDMGNCMERSAPKQLEEDMKPAGAADGGVTKEGSCKVKILLTRKELEWLVLHLKENGEQRLEDVLVEMQREMEKERGKAKVWKPALESIEESPVVQNVDVVV
ncbi:hypothetical protein BHE74_00048738 [Ensete ventricosum]|nr:hypothetical protein BHE74_00048738 [Ensete ventricosum]